MATFDPRKDAGNRRKHGLSLAFGSQVLADPFMIENIDDRMDYGEERWNVLGMVDSVIYALTYVDRAAGPHFISVRRASKQEVAIYHGSQ